MDAVDRIGQLKQDIGLFSEEEDGRLALLCYGDTRTGEMRGFTYGDLRALCEIAGAGRDVLSVADGEDIDLSHCPYYRKQHGLPGGEDDGDYGPGTCLGGCVDEPACMTSGPWATERMREALARLNGEGPS